MNFGKEIRRAFGTITAMLRARGVDVSSLDRLSADDIVTLAASRNVFHVDLTSCKHRVVFNTNAKFRLADVRKMLDEEDAQVDTYLVVARERPNTATLKSIDELARDVQIFEFRELMFDVSRHTLVPKHVPVRDEADIETLVKRFRLKSRFQFPLILSSDPMARYLALKHGQLVRITRESPSAGSYVLFRCCMRAAA